MGERILREEGYEVICIADGVAAIERFDGFDPDIIVADIHMPGRSGYDLCVHAKASNPHVRVVLTAGLLEPVDDGEVQSCGSDALLKKPFEATAVLNTIRPLVAQARLARGLAAEESNGKPKSSPAPAPKFVLPPMPVRKPPPLPAPPIAAATAPIPAPALDIDRERVEAAVVLALERAMPTLIREVTDRVITALHK